MRARNERGVVAHLLDCAGMLAGLGMALALALLIDSCVHGNPAWGEPAYVATPPLPRIEAGPLPHIECKRADVAPVIQPLCCFAKRTAVVGDRWEFLGCVR